MKIVCENIDRLITTESRLPALPRGIAPVLYDVARSNGDPITYQIAKKYKNMINAREDLTVGIFTGVWNAEWLPKGENDGPIGAVALGKTLYLAGVNVTYYVEKEIIPVMERMCSYLEIPANIVALSRDSAQKNAKIADEIDSAIFIEKIGPSKKGIHHFATGLARQGQDAPLESMFNKLKEKNKLTVGIGDMGNEIGFGKIYDTVKKVHPFGENCLCDEKDGFGTVLATDYMLPAAISNVGAYGICAALALMMEDLDMLHEPKDELELIQICTDMDCRDGGFGKAHNFVDGVVDQAIASFVEILKEMVTIYFKKEKRAF